MCVCVCSASRQSKPRSCNMAPGIRMEALLPACFIRLTNLSRSLACACEQLSTISLSCHASFFLPEQTSQCDACTFVIIPLHPRGSLLTSASPIVVIVPSCDLKDELKLSTIVTGTLSERDA